MALTTNNLPFCREPINSMLVLVIKTYRKSTEVGYVSSRCSLGFRVSGCRSQDAGYKGYSRDFGVRLGLLLCVY